MTTDTLAQLTPKEKKSKDKHAKRDKNAVADVGGVYVWR